VKECIAMISEIEIFTNVVKSQNSELYEVHLISCLESFSVDKTVNKVILIISYFIILLSYYFIFSHMFSLIEFYQFSSCNVICTVLVMLLINGF
jgi:hypothetical protein